MEGALMEPGWLPSWPTPECTYECRRGCDHPTASSRTYIDRDKSHAAFLKEIPTERYRAWLGAFRVKGRWSLAYRRSSGGHTHLRVYGPSLTEHEGLLLRAHLGDDWKRIVLDMKRLAQNNAQVDRAWDVRYTAGKLVKSGEWVPWFETTTQ